MYKISLEKNIFNVWAGQFVKETTISWNQKNTLHSENFELFLPTNGTLRILVNGEKKEVTENECLLIPPNSLLESSGPINHELTFYWIHFLASWKYIDENNAELQDGLSKIVHHQYTDTLNNSVILPECFRMNHPQRTFLRFRDLLDNSSRYCYSQRGNDYLTTLILLSLSDDFLENLSEETLKKVKKTATIAEWIRVNISNDISVKKIADHFEMNPNYLSRLFSSEQGITIKDCILNYKLENAKFLLLSTILPISEIAELSFFGDSKHFMKIFKQKIGVTPTNYRNQYSYTHMNTVNVNPSSPIPEQFGNSALKKMIKDILSE